MLQKRIAPEQHAVDYAGNLYILDKRDQLIPYHPNRVQLHLRQHRTGRDLVLKARQFGVSTEIQADHFVQSITRRIRSATLAHDDAGTQLLRRMADRFWSGLPDHIRPPRGLDNATTTTYATTESEVFIATAGGKNKGRAGTYTLAHGSEVAFWTDAAAVMAGLLQGVPKDGQIILESTPNGAQGWFYERCMEALDGNSDWTLHFFEWWWGDDYRLPLDEGEALEPYSDDELALITAHDLSPEQIKWRRAKQRELGRLFLQEYPEDPRSCFLLSGVGYFGNLEQAFKAPDGAVYNRLHRYYAGLDFAQTQDYTVLSIIDQTTLQQVALLRVNRLSWSEMRRQVASLCKHWNVLTLVAEDNSMGSTNIEELRKELRSMGCETAIQRFHTSNSTKAQAMATLHEALHEGGLTLLNESNQKREFMAFQSKQTLTGLWQFSAPEGEHDDTVIATALAIQPIFGRRAISVETSRWA